ncbi:MAG: hypothetical protein RLZZ136_37, partial [Pseudomonadota bacterium]
MCPACKTRYAVPDSTIGNDGRTVRCTKCKNAWFQTGPEQVAIAPDPLPQPEFTQPQSTEPQFTPPLFSQSSPVPPEPVAADEAPAVPAAAARPVAARYDDTETPFIQTRSSFAHEPLFQPRRSLIKVTTYAAVVFALLISAAIAAVTWYGLPDWVPFASQNFGRGEANLQLEFPQNQVNRHIMPNGAEFISVRGKVTNIGKERLPVPPLRIVLRDGNKQIVYTEDLVAPKSQL